MQGLLKLCEIVVLRDADVTCWMARNLLLPMFSVSRRLAGEFQALISCPEDRGLVIFAND